MEYYLSDENLVRDAFFQAPKAPKRMESDHLGPLWQAKLMLSTVLGSLELRTGMSRP